VTQDRRPTPETVATAAGVSLATVSRCSTTEQMFVDTAADGGTTSPAAVVHARTLEVLDLSRRMLPTLSRFRYSRFTTSTRSWPGSTSVPALYHAPCGTAELGAACLMSDAARPSNVSNYR
jgi:hypothetical protein